MKNLLIVKKIKGFQLGNHSTDEKQSSITLMEEVKALVIKKKNFNKKLCQKFNPFLALLDSRNSTSNFIVHQYPTEQYSLGLQVLPDPLMEKFKLGI